MPLFAARKYKNATGHLFWVSIEAMAYLEASVSTVKELFGSIASVTELAMYFFRVSNSCKVTWSKRNLFTYTRA